MTTPSSQPSTNPLAVQVDRLNREVAAIRAWMTLHAPVGGSSNEFPHPYQSFNRVQIGQGDRSVSIDELDGVVLVSDLENEIFTVENVDATKTLQLGVSGAGAVAQMLFRGSTTRHCRLFFIDQVVSAGASASFNDAFGTASATVRNAMVSVAIFRDANGATLGHVYGSVADGETLYTSTVDTEASSAGTTDPSIGMASSGPTFAAHATFDTRFVGWFLVAYDDV